MIDLDNDNGVDPVDDVLTEPEADAPATVPVMPIEDLAHEMGEILKELKALDARVDALSFPVVQNIGHHAVAQIEQVKAGLGHAFGNLAHPFAHLAIKL